MVLQAHKHRLKVATHAHGADAILASVKAGVASIEHGSRLTDQIIKEMKQRRTYLVPITPIMNKASLQDPNLPQRVQRLLKRALKAINMQLKLG